MSDTINNSAITKTFIQGAWECILCRTPVFPPGTSHYCSVENRIREIIREELDKFAQQRSDQS